MLGYFVPKGFANEAQPNLPVNFPTTVSEFFNPKSKIQNPKSHN
jgi:hypothetical protein